MNKINLIKYQMLKYAMILFDFTFNYYILIMKIKNKFLNK